MNNDFFEDQVENVQEEIIQEVKDCKCPQCGANMNYNAESEGLKCDYCGFSLNLNGETSSVENDFLSANVEDNWKEDAQTASCPNCGSKNVVDRETISCVCPFCNTPLMFNLEELKGAKPDRVIPFKISNQMALENYKKWLKKKFYVPSKLKKDIPNPVQSGVYIPSWTFDTNSFSNYKGRLGKTYTTTVGSGKNRRTVTRVRWFRISGVHQKTVDDILICSGKQLSQNDLEKISPFNTNDSYVYDNRYLAGHVAEHYQLDLKDGWSKAQNIIRTQIRSEILSQYYYDRIDYLEFTPVYTDIKYKYVLVPIWISHYIHKNKKFIFYVNGESGKISGKYPVSVLKVLMTVVLIAALIIGVLLFIYFN